MSSSRVIAFPLYRRQQLLSSIAGVFRSKQAEDASQLWRATAKHLLHQLLSSGVEQEAAEQEVRQLLFAVLREIEKDSAQAGA